MVRIHVWCPSLYAIALAIFTGRVLIKKVFVNLLLTSSGLWGYEALKEKKYFVNSLQNKIKKNMGIENKTDHVYIPYIHLERMKNISIYFTLF